MVRSGISKQLILQIRTVVVLCLVLSMSSVCGQDELDDLLDEVEGKTTDYVIGAFKSTRVINLHTIELVGPKTLEFRISHRFGPLNGEVYNFFGLDWSTMRLSLEYGISKWLMLGLGRSTYKKTVEGFIKVKIIRQSRGERVMPFSLIYFSSAAINGSRANYYLIPGSRFAYVHQLIAGRKMNSNLSLQLSPTIVHKNIVLTKDDKNTSYAIGASGRYKITSRMAITTEYIYRLQPKVKTTTYISNYDSFSIGMDIETGGHVFAFHLTNSLSMIEKGFITETNDSWSKGGIYIGFNISREFAPKK